MGCEKLNAHVKMWLIAIYTFRVHSACVRKRAKGHMWYFSLLGLVSLHMTGDGNQSNEMESNGMWR
jgi:hypothetical protein